MSSRAGAGRAYDLAIVGGGIAGLAAAWEAVSRRPGARVLVVEASHRFGGKLHTGELEGHAVDRGADAFLVRTPDALDLLHELGLDDEVVHPAQRAALLLSGGRLHRLPEGLVLGVPTDLDALAASGIISPEGLARAAADLDASPSGGGAGGSAAGGDLTVGELVRSRLGDEVFEKLVSPLLSGVNAGDADRLSVEAGAPQLAAAARHGSLIRGARALRAAGDPDRPVFASLRTGTGRLVERLVERLTEGGVELQAATAATALARTETGGWALTLSPSPLASSTEIPEAADGVVADRVMADRVVLATPLPVTARLLDGSTGDGPAPGALGPLADLEYASVAVVTLVYRRASVDHPLDASGILVAQGEGLLMTACSFGSAKWPAWADPDVALFRVSTGRAADTRHLAYLEHNDGAGLAARLHDELAPVLGLHEDPTTTVVTPWSAALPQYRPGHLDRLDAAEAVLAERAPGLALAGAGTRGIGIPACIRSGRMAVGQVWPRPA